MRILTLALLLVLTACAPEGSSSAGTQETTASKAAEAPQPAPPAETPAPVPQESVEPQETVPGESVEPQPQPTDAEPTDPAKTAHGEPAAPADPSSARRPAEELLTQDGVDYSCKTNADCEVKNVGNCCGYYPACVNTNSPTFPDKVKAACAAEGMNSICGFPEISGCTCVEGRCAPVSGPGGGGDVR